MSEGKVADLPAVNWFVNALVTNTAYCTWDDPQDRTKVTHHPIPPGKDLILEEGKHVIRCNSAYTRSLITELARRYEATCRLYDLLLREKQASSWRPASEKPLSPYAAFHVARVLVTSPALLYVVTGGVAEGCYDVRTDSWHVYLNGHDIRHEISHWRYFPPPAGGIVEYEKVKKEVEELQRMIKQ